MAINFTSCKDSDKTRTTRTISDYIETMMSSETDEIIEEYFKPFLQRYQEGLQESMKGNSFLMVSICCITTFNK